MTLRELLPELLDQGNAGPPTARALIDSFFSRAKKVMIAGPERKRPKWSGGAHTAEDVFLDLDGDLIGLQLYEDSRGWGAYAELSVRQGTRADVEAVVGLTRPMPRAPEAFDTGDKVAAYVERGGKTIRVFTELVRSGPDVARVTVHFQR